MHALITYEHFEHKWHLPKPHTYKMFSFRFVVHCWCHLQWMLLQIWITLPGWLCQSGDTSEVIQDCDRYHAVYWLHISSVMEYLNTCCSLHTHALTTAIITLSQSILLPGLTEISGNIYIVYIYIYILYIDAENELLITSQAFMD